jgi:hypothetical protein
VSSERRRTIISAREATHMQDANAAPDGVDAAAAAAVAPLLELRRAAHEAAERSRTARALELHDRALAAAEASQPPESLIVAMLVSEAATGRVVKAGGDRLFLDASMARRDDRHHLAQAAWRSDEQLLPLSQRGLALLHARWRDGTLFALTPAEQAFVAGCNAAPAQLTSTRYYCECAFNAAAFWPLLRAPAEEEARLHGVYGALQTALEVDASGYLEHFAAKPAVQLFFSRLYHLLGVTFERPADALLAKLCATCGLSYEDEAALRRLQQRLRAGYTNKDPKSHLRVALGRAVADAERPRLRGCALPGCGDVEPQPFAFKLCGRCSSVVYCCEVHAVEDWKRHARQDGCKPLPAADRGSAAGSS